MIRRRADGTQIVAIMIRLTRPQAAAPLVMLALPAVLANWKASIAARVQNPADGDEICITG